MENFYLYRNPDSPTDAGARRAADAPEMISADVGIAGVFSDSWKIFRKFWGRFVFVGVLVWLTALFPVAAGEFGRADFSAADEEISFFDEAEPENGVAGTFPDDGNAAERIGAGTRGGEADGGCGTSDSASGALTVACLSFAYFAGVGLLVGVFSMGILSTVRKADAGTPISRGDLFPLRRCLRRLWKIVVLSLVWLVLAVVFYMSFIALAFMASAAAFPVLLGNILFLVASLAAFVRFGFAGFVLFDTDCGVFAALRASLRMTRGRFRRTLGFGLLFHSAAFLGAAFPPGLGAILLFPLLFVWVSVYYVKLVKTTGADVPAGAPAGGK